MAGSTKKIAINNEIVLMRQAVRQSRVAVVRKLIKEAKLLRARHGDEKIQEKCKRKAQRMGAEIEALKKLKDDEISKYGITISQTLQDVLNDMSVEPSMRVMTRLVYHKSLKNRITKFKEKFPDYEQYLGPGRKKLSKIQRQEKRAARNAPRNSGTDGISETSADALKDEQSTIINENLDEASEEGSSFEENEGDNDSEGIIESAVDELMDKDNKLDDSVASEYGSEPGSILRINTPKPLPKKKIDKELLEVEAAKAMEKSPEKTKHKNNEKKKSECIVTVDSSNLAAESVDKTKAKSIKNEEKKNSAKSPVLQKKPKPIRVVSKEATVKRFADLIEDKETEECIETADINKGSKQDVKLEKQVDSFFMTANGDSEYLSVVVPKAAPCEEPEDDDRFAPNHAARRKNFHERNNKFFSKIDQRANGPNGAKFNGNVGKRKQNDFSNRGPPEKFSRIGNGPSRPPRTSRPEMEKTEPKNEELHPSWAARKKQQEILKQGFQGKKIVFGD